MKINTISMRYTYQFTQVSRYENGELVPIKENPYMFVFTFGKKIEVFLGEKPDNTVLLTKDMWKGNPAKNEEILPTVCFSTPSLRGFRRPLVMSKKADEREGEYKYELVYNNEIKDGKYLSEDLRQLTETFVNGVMAVNDNTISIPWHNLSDANVKYLMSYIKSEVYKQLLQDKDNRGRVRSEEYLKNVLESFFSLIPNSIIKKFDDGLVAHDEVREKLEGVPEDDTATIKAVLKSQGYFNDYEDFRLFVVLRKYILSVKNRFNHLVWVMYRSKVGLVSLKSVRAQLSAMFGFVSKVQDGYRPTSKKEILEAISGKDCSNIVRGFLEKIKKEFKVEKLNKTHRAAVCYKFQKECHHKYLNNRYKYFDDIYEKIKTLHQEEFRDLCCRYWGIDEKNTLRRNKCEHLIDKFGSYYYNKTIWDSMKE